MVAGPGQASPCAPAATSMTPAEIQITALVGRHCSCDPRGRPVRPSTQPGLHHCKTASVLSASSRDGRPVIRKHSAFWQSKLRAASNTSHYLACIRGRNLETCARTQMVSISTPADGSDGFNEAQGGDEPATSAPRLPGLVVLTFSEMAKEKLDQRTSPLAKTGVASRRESDMARPPLRNCQA